MKIAIFDDMTQCNDLEVQKLLNHVSNQRRLQALRYKHIFGQFCCLKSYDMLIQLMKECSMEFKPLPYCAFPEFFYNQYGKPYIPGSLDFSISHCKKAIAVSVCEYNIGIDIESLRNISTDLIKHTMNKTEIEKIKESVNPQEEFTRLWTQKEAVVKFRGTGIISDMKEILSNHDAQLITYSFPEKGYVLSVALPMDKGANESFSIEWL